MWRLDRVVEVPYPCLCGLELFVIFDRAEWAPRETLHL